MALTPSQIFIGRIATLLGFVQGLAWSGMSLACIILYNTEHTDEVSNGDPYSKILNSALNSAYLNHTDPYKLIMERVIQPKDFAILMWFYFFVSVALTAASVDLFLAIIRNKERHGNMMIIWGLITGATSIIDLVVTSLLLRDFSHCPNNIEITFMCHTIIGIVMTLSARGFMLWIINVYLSYVMISTGIQISTHLKVNSVIQDISIPRAKMPMQSSPSMNSNYRAGPSMGSHPSTFQQSPNEYPSFIKNGNRFAY